jgi:hypothetical protein
MVPMRSCFLIAALLFADLATFGFCQPLQSPQSPSAAPASSVSPAKSNPFMGGQIPPEAKPAMRYTPDARPEDTRTPQERCDLNKDKERTGILSETEGVDFKVYMGQVQRITQSNWKPLIPKEVNRPFNKKGEADICFALLPSGQVEPKSMVLTARSGDTALDRAAWGAIQTSVFPPLPEEFKGPRLMLLFHFRYNLDQHPDPTHHLPGPPDPLGPFGVTFGYSAKR